MFRHTQNFGRDSQARRSETVSRQRTDEKNGSKTRGSSSAASEGSAAIVATAARVIVTGHMCPFSTCAIM